MSLGTPTGSARPAHAIQAASAETSGAAGANQRIEEGFQFLALASELKYMLSGLKDDINQTNWRAADAVGIDEAVGDAVVRY